MYREYMSFFDKGERTRRWHPLNDIPWDWLEQPENAAQIRDGRGPAAREDIATCLETFCAVELFIPDYTKNGLNLSRDIFGQAWFHLAWGYEESKHALSFREYLLRSGLRTLDDYADFEARILAKEWRLPFESNRQMACYGALQEIATYLIYANQRDKFERENNPVLKEMFRLISRDEAAHTSFYRQFVAFELQEDPDGALSDLAFVISRFEMPGKEIVPDYYERLETSGVGLTSQDFLARGILPMLRQFGIHRSDLIRALRAREAPRDNSERDALARPPWPVPQAEASAALH
jgi:acyl-[acyl-carrier-protein] desaturase